MIHKIKDLGFKISIDDFGTGYSSLSYISHLNSDEIKLDKSFIQGIEESEKDRNICKLIIHLCHELDVQVVAEGVETQVQLDFLEKEGVDIIQGYVYSRPKPFSKV
jgi:EAL domain-containing protein (putative c-di-GMP-specific phosphodiesterase class I)